MKFIEQEFPSLRFRRNRKSEKIRNLISETNISANDLIWPIFICEGNNVEQNVPSMPGVKRRSIDRLVEAASEAFDLGIPAICLFPYTEQSLKTEDCAEAWNPDNLSNKASRAIKKAVPDLVVMSDVALDPYNINGHDGFVENGKIVNDKTVEALVKQALSQAEAGVDVIGPSDMMDGRILAIRSALETNGYSDVAIMSYSAKYSSSFYGPFRDAVGASGALTGDKKTYQMDIANSNEALRLVARDLKEGADMVMIKPGLPYLDKLQKIKESFKIPTFAYQVSGEYSMIMNAIEKKWFKKNEIIIENLISFKRAGADGIVTYFADQVAEMLERKEI